MVRRASLKSHPTRVQLSLLRCKYSKTRSPWTATKASRRPLCRSLNETITLPSSSQCNSTAIHKAAATSGTGSCSEHRMNQGRVGGEMRKSSVQEKRSRGEVTFEGPAQCRVPQENLCDLPLYGLECTASRYRYGPVCWEE